MIFPIDRCAVSTGDVIPSTFNKTVYFIENVYEYPGYVRLVNEGTYMMLKDVHDDTWPTDGPANRTLIYPHCLNISAVDQSLEHLEDTDFKINLPIDNVRCIYSPYWPKVASEWVTRKRLNGWPTTDIVDRIVRGGIHFVAKPHPKCSEDNTMFRCSFSRAEVVLINSFSAVQKYVYHIIRVVKKNLEEALNHDDYESPLCTYHFKTLMLWACEEKSLEFWNENAIESSIEKLLLKMTEWLIERKFPSFFIAHYNLMDHLEEQRFDFEKEINWLVAFVPNINSLIAITPQIQPQISLQSLPIGLSNKIFVIMEHLFCQRYLYVSPLDLNWNERLFQDREYSRLVIEEFSNLFDGVKKHYRFVTEVDKYWNAHGLEALQCLNKAFVGDQGRTSVLFQTGDTLLNFIERCVFRKSIDIHDSENGYNEILRNVYRKLFKHEILNSDTGSSKYHSPIYDFSISWAHMFLEAFDTMLPNISYFVSAAYLANFYYATQMDYDAAIQICKCALLKLWNMRFVYSHCQQYDKLCPVVLNSKLIALFDPHIQTVFGFVLLFNAVQSKLDERHKARGLSNSSVGLSSGKTSSSTSTVQFLTSFEFLKYIQQRCELKLGLPSDPTNCPKSGFLLAALNINDI